jgi:hypothetical protein
VGRFFLATKFISLSQATNIVEAVTFAKSVGLPLVAHLTIHWSGTVAFDDHDGTRFAKVREGLSKVLLRRGIPAAWAWCRECKAHTNIVHCHLLFHLPVEYRSGPKLIEMEAHLVRLVDHHGGGILGEYAVRLEYGRILTASISSRAVVPRCGSCFLASRRNGAWDKASFMARGAGRRRTSVLLRASAGGNNKIAARKQQLKINMARTPPVRMWEAGYFNPPSLVTAGGDKACFLSCLL